MTIGPLRVPREVKRISFSSSRSAMATTGQKVPPKKERGYREDASNKEVYPDVA